MKGTIIHFIYFFFFQTNRLLFLCIFFVSEEIVRQFRLRVEHLNQINCTYQTCFELQMFAKDLFYANKP